MAPLKPRDVEKLVASSSSESPTAAVKTMSGGAYWRPDGWGLREGGCASEHWQNDSKRARAAAHSCVCDR